jgi:hypothetical protein
MLHVFLQGILMAKHKWAKKTGYEGYVCEKCGKRQRVVPGRRPGGAVGLKRGGCRVR